jgi:GTP-binding protein YchF
MSTNLEVGILGLPNIGKTTLFNALTKAGAAVSSFVSGAVEPNVGVVEVPDERLAKLAEMYKPKKVTPTKMQFIDIAGLGKGASKGAGLGNKFLSHIRQVDAVIEVVRCFSDPGVMNADTEPDPLGDIEILNTELCLADLETLEKRQERLQKMLKSGDKKIQVELDLISRLKPALEEITPVRQVIKDEEEAALVRELNLLTLKPILYVANIDEAAAADPEASPYVQAVKGYAAKDGAEAIAICAKLEAEIAELSEEEAATFLAEMGLSEPGLTKVIKEAYRLLGLISFLTAGEDEVRAWTIKLGTKAQKAAGKIHSDIERGFIRAELVAYSDLMAAGSMNAAKDKGQVRLEGKEYIMKDGDVVNFRFNV